MWSNGFQRNIELAVPDGLAAAILIALPAGAALGAAWLYFADPLARLAGMLCVLLLALVLVRREAGTRARRRVVRAVRIDAAGWELVTAAGQRLEGRLARGWELRRIGLLGLGWVTPDGHRYLVAFAAQLPAAALRRLRVHRRLAADSGQDVGTPVTLRRGHPAAGVPIGEQNRRQ